MYQLFTKLFNSQNAVIRPPEFEYIKRTYQAQLDNITEYYHNRVFAVPSQNLICRLLTTAEIPIQYELDRFLEVAYTRSPYTAKQYNFTSDINYGLIKPSVFYGSDNHEIILYNEDYFDAHSEIRQWQQIQAIKVVEHPFSDLGLLLPTGINHSTDNGLVVMSINIPLLLLQYRCFVKQQQIKAYQGQSLLGVTHFVHMYVLPNILHSHLELCIINRLINLYYGAPMGEAIKKHPFPLIDYSSKIDKVLLSIVKRVQKTKMLYFSVLKNIPSIEHEDAQAALIMPDIAKTRQVWWALLLSRLRIIKFLIDIGGVSGIAMNSSFIGHLKTDLKQLLDENMIKALLSDDLYYDTYETIKDLVR